MIQVLPIVMGIVFYVVSIAYFGNLGWDQGYDAASKRYKDWDRGFNSGWEAASKRFVDYDLGFKDGWQAAEKSEQGPLADINPKDIPTMKRIYE